MARSLLVALFPPVLLSQEGKVGVGVSTSDVPQPSTSSSSTSASFQVGMLFKFFDQWKSITSNRFVLNMVWGHHFQLRSCPPLFHDFQHFNVKVAAAHHPVIQKEVDELLSKGAIELSSSGAGFYSSMFVVPKHTGGLCPILNLKVLICSKQEDKRACLFLCSLLVHLGLHINFSRSDLHLSQSFTFLGLCWDTVCMSVSLPPGKLAEIQQLALSLLQTPHVTVHKVMSFLGKANFCTNGHSQLCYLCCVIQSDMLSVYHSPTQIF